MHNVTDTNITAGERAVLRSLLTNDFATDDGAPVWADSINDAAEPSGIEGPALSATVSSLSRKGLVACHHSGREATVQLTDAGLAATR